MKIAFFILLVILSFSVHGKKYAIIVDGDDSNFASGLSSHFTSNADTTAALYVRNGYEVVRVNASEGATGISFRETLESLTDVESIDIAFFTHGALQSSDSHFRDPITESQLNRFPVSHLRTDEVTSQFTGGTQVSSSVRFAFAMNTERLKSDDWIGLGDLHDGLAELKLKNPRMVTTIQALSCFSGAAIRALDDIPDVQVLASANSSQTAIAFSKTEDHSLLQDYTTFLNSELSKGLNYTQAHTNARESYLASRIRFNEIFGHSDHEDSYLTSLIRPQNSLELYFSDLCLGAPERTEVNRCEFPNSESTLNQLTGDISRVGVFNYLNQFIDSEKRYLNTLSSTHSCQGQDRSIPLKKDLLVRAKEKIILQYQSKLTMTNKEIEDYWSNKVSQIRNAASPQEAIPYLESLQEIKIMEGLILYPNEEIFEEMKEDASLRFNSYARQSTAVNYQEIISEHIRMLQSSSDLEGCIESSCDINSITSNWLLNNRSLPFENRGLLLNLKENGKHLLASQCSQALSFSNSNDSNYARDRQIACIDNVGLNEPLQALAMYEGLKDREEFSENQRIFCANLNREQDINHQLETCLHSLGTRGDTSFWEKMLNLQSLGLRTL